MGSKLTNVEQEVLRFVAEHGPGVSYSGDTVRQRSAAIRLLERGLLGGRDHRSVGITPAGRTALSDLASKEDGRGE